MSCKHGNHPDACDICVEIDEAYKSGVADGRQAAIAAQEPKQAMTDAEIDAMWAAVLATQPLPQPAYRALARAIIAATSPNKELVEALKDIVEDTKERYDMNSPSTNPGIKNCVERGIAALRAAGVEVAS